MRFERMTLWIGRGLIAGLLLVSVPAEVSAQFRRGDVNDDGEITEFDVCLLQQHLFMAAPIPCADAADVDDSGALNNTDVISLLNLLCTPATPPPPAPGPTVCGPDPTADPLGCASYTSCAVVPIGPNSRFIRGDCDTDQTVTLGDAITMLSVTPYLCDDACDSNDDGLLNIADPIHLLNFLFAGGPPPPAPAACGCDNFCTDGLDCRNGGCP